MGYWILILIPQTVALHEKLGKKRKNIKKIFIFYSKMYKKILDENCGKKNCILYIVWKEKNLSE